MLRSMMPSNGSPGDDGGEDDGSDAGEAETKLPEASPGRQG